MYTQTRRQLCISPGGCEHPECIHVRVSLPPCHQSRAFLKCTATSESSKMKRWFLTSERGLDCGCIVPAWVIGLCSPRCISWGSFWIGHSTAVLFKWSCCLCLLPSPSLFCLLAELQGKLCLKIPCIGFVLSLSAFQSSWMCMCAA